MMGSVKLANSTARTCLVLLAIFCVNVPAFGQQPGLREPRGIQEINKRVLIDDLLLEFGRGQRVVDVIDDSSDGMEEDSGQYAVLKTDPDLESILEKAERFAKDRNWNVATKLWQAVLDRSGDAMHSNDGKIYHSLADQVERKLAELPPEGLKAYRVLADAEAKAILAAAKQDQRSHALGQIIGNFFVSSIGDDAAFELGCLNLDRYDFVGALRLFEKLLTHYPDSDVPRDQVYLRIALCHAFLGNEKSANAAILATEKLLAGQPATGSVSVAQLKDSLPSLTIDSVSSIKDNAIRMHLSGSRRRGVMPSLPKDFMNRDLAAIWQFYVEPKTNNNWASLKGHTLIGRRSHGDSAKGTRNHIEDELIKEWRSKGWRPAGHLLFEGNHIFFKSTADIAAWDRRTIDELSFGATDKSDPLEWVAWRSVWRNAFELDAATKAWQMVKRRYGNYRRNRNSTQPDSPEPASPNEVQFFGDAVFQQMSIHDGVLYAIEGKRFDERRLQTGRDRNIRRQNNISIRRTRKNWLTAYDAKSGRLKWSLPPENSESEDLKRPDDANEKSPWLTSGGFMAAPIGYEEMLLVPVNESGAIVVYALDPSANGRTIWKSFLCDEPETGAVAWSPIHLSLDGGDLFVNTGLGAIFVLDASTGKIRFARRYPRKGSLENSVRVYNARQSRLKFDGWTSDIVIPWQDQLICFGSDTDMIFALDRRTGRAIWTCPMNPIGHQVDYLLGVVDGTLYAAGPTTIIAYDLNGEGRMLWGAEDLFDGKISKGRGMLTEKAIYIPVDNGIYQFSLNGKKGRAEAVSKVGVSLGTDAPVGNLFSDGQRIWVHGGNRLYALGPNMDE